MTETLPTAEELQAKQPKAGTVAIDCPLERIAITLLYKSGWSYGEIGMCFQVSESTARDVVNNETQVPNPPALPEGME